MGLNGVDSKSDSSDLTAESRAQVGLFSPALKAGITSTAEEFFVPTISILLGSSALGLYDL